MGATVDILLYEMESFLEEQREILQKIEGIKLLLEGAKDKHIIDYHERELKKLLEELYSLNLDMNTLYVELEK